MSKKRRYIDVNVPREWEQYLNEALEIPNVLKGLELAGRERLPSSLGVWIIEQWLIENTKFRFEHFNTFEDHATIKDKKVPNLLLVLLNQRMELISPGLQTGLVGQAKFLTKENWENGMKTG